jgi:hypothetical protein
METAAGSRLFRQTPRTFLEAASALRPLPNVSFDTEASAWRLTGDFDDTRRFVVEGDAPAPPPPAAAHLKLVMSQCAGFEGAAPQRVFALLRLRGFAPLVTAVADRVGAGAGGVWTFPQDVAVWGMRAGGGGHASPSKSAASEIVEVEIWDGGVDAPTTTPSSPAYTLLGRAAVDLSRALLRVPLSEEGGGGRRRDAGSAALAQVTARDFDTMAALSARRVQLEEGAAENAPTALLRVWLEDVE